MTSRGTVDYIVMLGGCQNDREKNYGVHARFLGGEGLSEALYHQIWSKFKFEHSCAMLVAVGKLPSSLHVSQ